jgi:hypothetical protein
MSFNDPIDGTNAGGSGGSSGSTGGSSGGLGGGGTTGGSTGGLGGGDLGGTSGGSTGGYGGSTGGTGGSTGGLGGSTGGTTGSDAGGYGGSTGGTGGSTGGTTGGDAGGYGGSTGGLGGSTGGLGGSTGGTTGGDAGGYGSTGGLGGSTSGGGSSAGLGDGSPGLGGSTGGTGEVGGTGDDFDLHEPTYRRHYTTVGTETAGGTGTYDEARTGYAAGHAAASNPVYADRTYQEVEVDLERNVGSERFARVRDFARHSFEWKRVLAGLAVVAGGYWASKKLFAAASELSDQDEQDCRTYYETHPMRSAGVPYSQARTVYVLGYVAGRNPDYSGRAYDEVEPHLRGGYTGRGTGSYDALRDFGRRGYERSAGAATGTGFGTGGV